MTVVAWILGAGGMLANFLIFQQTTRKRLLTVKLLSDFFWAMHYSFLGAWSGAAVGAIGMIRETVFLNADKKWAQGKRWLLLFLGLGVVSVIVTWKNGFSVLPAIASSLSIFSFWKGDPKLTKLLAYPISGCFIIYDIVCRSYVGIMSEAIVLISTSVGLFRLRNERHKVCEHVASKHP